MGEVGLADGVAGQADGDQGGPTWRSRYGDTFPASAGHFITGSEICPKPHSQGPLSNRTRPSLGLWGFRPGRSASAFPRLCG